MSDNLTLNAGTGGATLACASLTFSGDTADVQVVGCGILSGSEGSWSLAQFSGNAGAADAGTQRVVVATDSPDVTHLATIAGDTTSLDTKVTACNTGAVVIASGAVTATLSAETTKVIGTVNVAAAQTIAVTGTFWQATQPVSGTFWQATQPVSLASVPSHAVTNAGTFAVQVDGAALTALQLIDNAVSGAGFNITQLAGAAVPIGAGVEATAVRVTLATDSTGVISIDDGGNVITVDGTVAVSGSVAVTGTFWQATQPVSGTFWQATQPVSLASVPSHAVTNAGTFAVQVDGAALTALQLIDNCISGNEAQVDVVAALPAGTNTIGGVIGQASASVVYDGTTACTVKRFHVVTSTSGAAVIAAPTGTKKILVLSLSAMALSATAFTWYLETGTTGTDTFGTAAGPITFDMNGGDGPAGLVLPWNPGGWFKTADADEALEVVLSAAQLILLCGNYIEVA